MTDRNVGKLGELTLAQWCAQVGITANRAEQDLSGWDYLLEFPIRLSDCVAFDLLPMPLSCRVQVKSTDRRDRRISIALSNLLRFVHDPLPAFFLIFEFDGNNVPSSAFLLHVDEQLIHSVLKRLREISLKPGAQPHRHRLAIHYGPEKALPALDGDSFAQQITNFVGDSPGAYVQWKLHAVRTAGYDDWPTRLKANIHIHDTGRSWQERLVDASIGLGSPEFELASFQTHDVRFGIESPPLNYIEGGKLILSPKSEGQGTVCFTSPDLKQTIEIRCSVYLPRGLGNIVADEHLKIRFASDLVQFLIWPFTGRWRMNFKWPTGDEPVALHAVRAIGELIHFLNLARLGGYTYDIDFRYNDLRHGGPVSHVSDFGEEWVMLAKMINNAAFVAEASGLSFNSFGVRPEDFVSQTQRFEITESLLKSDVRSFSWQFSVGTSIPEGIRVATALVIPLRFGDDYLMMGFSLSATPQLMRADGEEFRYTTHAPEVEFWDSEIEPAHGDPPGVRASLLQKIGSELDKRENTIWVRGE